MIPFFKIFSLVIRIFTRPMVNYTKKLHIGQHKSIPGAFRTSFIRLGNKYNQLETYINRKFLKIETPDDLFIKPLSEDVALEKGIEFFYEILIYLILILLPLYELYITAESTQKKTDELSTRLKLIEDSISTLKSEHEKHSDQLNKSLDQLDKMIKKSEKTSTDITTQMSQIRKDLISYVNCLVVQNNMLLLNNNNLDQSEASS